MTATVEHSPTQAGAGDLAGEVATLQQLDVAALRHRWRALVGGTMPADLGRPLVLRVLAYKLQAHRLGDLDRASLRALAALGSQAEDVTRKGKSDGAPPDALLSSSGGVIDSEVLLRTRPVPARMARPGTVLVREHAGVSHRVMVLSDGFSWNNRSFDSLSQVAFAITGTKWNGPRFFGLREKADAASLVGKAPAKQTARAALAPVGGRGRATRSAQPSPMRWAL